MARQKDKTAEMEMRILNRIKEALEEGNPVRSLSLMKKIKNGLIKHSY